MFEAVLAYLDSLDIARCADPAAKVEAKFTDDIGAVLSASAIMVTRDQPPEVKLFYIRAARERHIGLTLLLATALYGLTT